MHFNSYAKFKDCCNQSISITSNTKFLPPLTSCYKSSAMEHRDQWKEYKTRIANSEQGVNKLQYDNLSLFANAPATST
jgi:hypothetical protein